MRPSLAERLGRKIGRMKGDVFLRQDFETDGGYDQVGRALRMLTAQGRLIRIGHGLYARAAPSVLDGKPALMRGIRHVAEEALGRLGIASSPSSSTRAYNENRTTQVPSGRVIGVNRRVRRKIGVNGTFVRFEHHAEVACRHSVDKKNAGA